ncbi:HEPN domain-containing protein [Streptomyces sp. SAS_269]|uniref:HEPN domain-containing protein n=1 Tax=Streptomyces sp. SAS_269 TaxID=3412749 RepID=UPI00403CF988
MTSPARQELIVGIAEVKALRAFPPRSGNGGASSGRVSVAAAAMAHRRACVVLLCSHFESYLYNVNEQAVDFLNSCQLPAVRIPLEMRLLQARQPIDEMSLKQWVRREENLIEFIREHSSMWSNGGGAVSLRPGPNLEWMKSPKVADVLRFYRLYGINDILKEVTRTQAGKKRVSRGIQSLVDSRNGIAHGDQTVQPVRTEITEFISVVDSFSERADRALSRRLGVISNAGPPPW